MTRVRRWAARLDLRRRVALLAAVAVGLAVALTALAAYLTVRNQLLSQTDAALLDRARSAATSPLTDPDTLARTPSEALGAADVRIVLVTPDGRVFTAGGARNVLLLGDSELQVARGREPESIRTATVNGQDFRVVAVPTDRGFALVLAQSMASVQQVLDRLGLVVLLVGALGVASAAAAGLAIARAGLRPVEHLTEAATRVAATGRLDPIDVPASGELARLAEAFNAMLAALAQSQERQRRLVADAGHELRTPLTSLRTNLDLLAQSEGSDRIPPAERAALLADVRAQVLELSTLVGDLVELSRDDPPVASDEPVDLAEVVRDALERVRRRAPSVGFAARLSPWHLVGDRPLLERAAANLLDNAAKWSPAGGVVRVELADGVLTVADEGPGIPERDAPHVFDRFWRSPESRGMPGSGLGLAIVRQAAERHGGAVAAGRSESGGALLTLQLPGQP